MADFSTLQRYRDLNVPVWVHDPHRHCQVWANDAALKFWRADSLDELRARSYADMSEGALSRLALAMRAHARGETTRDRWTLYPRGLPEAVQLHGSGFALPDGGQGILFIAEPPDLHDPSLLRGVEALLHTPMLVSMHQLSTGTVLMRNPAAALALGPIEENLCFLSSFEDQGLAQSVLDAVRQGQSSSLECRLLTRSGPRWYLIDVRPAWDPVSGQRALQLNAHDISELKTTQQALEAATRSAQAASQAKSAFLANMSHEIRTPLNGVLGVIQLVQRSPLSDDQQRWLGIARESGQLLLTLLNDLLDLSKIEAGRMEIERVGFDLRKLVSATIGPLSIEANGKGLGWHLQVDPTVPVQVAGDPIRLRQVLLNLAGNAVKFTGVGEIRIHVSATPLGDGDHRLTFEIRDTGIGMNEQQLARVLAPFSQADPSVTRRFGGSGLGLSIVDRLVGLMDGRLEVESTEGQGTCARCSVRVGPGGESVPPGRSDPPVCVDGASGP
ncbi:MAG: hypothetical protein KAY46_15735 [Burkholderiaceae bacterium]|nr:hypothetical protein [Burkholderiaceae bacterium]